MKNAFFEDSSNLSVISSGERSRSRSRSNNRTLTSSSASDIYDSRSSSPASSHGSANDENVLQVNYKKRRLSECSDSSPKTSKKSKILSSNNCNSGETTENQTMKHSTPLMQPKIENTHFNAFNLSNKLSMSAILQQQQSSPVSAFKQLQDQQKLLPFTQNPFEFNQIASNNFQNQNSSFEAANNKPMSLCAVCGDRASGKHYGVLSCDGCRGFFKRSIRGNMEYVCKENDKCVIDVSRRNQCQACRLRKCLEVKMNKDAVQHQRPPRSQQIRRDTSNNSQCSPSIANTTPNGFQSFTNYMYAEKPSPVAQFVPVTHNFPQQVYQRLPIYNSPFNVYSMQMQNPATFPTGAWNPQHNMLLAHQLLAKQNNADTNVPNMASPNISASSSGYCTSEDSSVNEEKDSLSKKDDSMKNSDVPKSENAYEIATRILFSTIKWARSQRSFFSLPVADQAALLEESWSDLFLLNAAEAKISIAENMFGSELSSENKKCVQTIVDVVSKFAQARVDPMEFFLLKSIIVFKSDVRNVNEKAKIEAIQDECMNALNNYTKTTLMTPAKFGRVLLLVSELRKVSSRMIEELFFKKILGTSSVENLLVDIFKTC